MNSRRGYENSRNIFRFPTCWIRGKWACGRLQLHLALSLLVLWLLWWDCKVRINFYKITIYWLMGIPRRIVLDWFKVMMWRKVCFSIWGFIFNNFRKNAISTQWVVFEWLKKSSFQLVCTNDVQTLHIIIHIYI